MRVRPEARVGAALVAGLVMGLAVARVGNPTLSRAVAMLEPVGTLWVNAIRMTVVPLVLALLLGAVARGGEESRFGRVGGLAFTAFGALHLAAALVALLVVPPIMANLPIDAAAAARLQVDATSAAAATSEQVRSLPSLGEWLAQLAPANVIRAAADGAMLPLIVFTVLFAVALRRVEASRRRTVLHVFDGSGAAMLVIVRWLILAAPIGVFTLVAPLAARLGVSLAGALGYYVLAYVGGMLAVTLVVGAVGALGGGVAPGRYVRAALPAQAVAFSSSSSLASLPALIDSAGRVGVRPAVSGFVLPLAVSSFKVAMSVSWLLGTMFLARLYDVPLRGATQLTVVATAVALSFATPGVPNGAFLLLAPLLASLGLPPAGVALLIAVDAIPDLFATVANVSGDFAAVAMVSRLAPAAASARADDGRAVPAESLDEAAPEIAGLR